ncbi:MULTISPECIES: hypothetical protein [Moorena]|uniref:Uncharacterized protein n=1 Tax=Moorena producens 3L TaxID=489825 RepID=F4XUE3_9CYAN|nr:MULTISPECIES: hypothetical protein [Moorena]EGJ31768.1 hypothetical protein LYNGBM3L_33440 [Moorena producens 3L]NEP66542.1 hypothetical protein [Moorena sp. SIO3A5]OLT63788.1 hypothetical protein BI334_01015 [Moorena producens 3L]
MVINLTRKVFRLPCPLDHRIQDVLPKAATDNTVLKRSRLGKHLEVLTRIRLNGLVNHGSWLSTKPHPSS